MSVPSLPTALQQASPAFRFCIAGNADVMALITNGAATNSTEVHILSAENLYRSFLEQTASAMHPTDDGFHFLLSPQRDLFASIAAGVEAFPGMTDDDQRYFRDVYDHLIRIGDMVDTYRDLLSGAMDVYLSTVSNRLNKVMKQLAIIATVFMPLTFLTGFFGQNLGWLVEHTGGLAGFLAFGIGLEVITLTIVLGYFYRRGWLGSR